MRPIFWRTGKPSTALPSGSWQKRPIPPTPPSSGCAGGWGSAGSGRCARCKANTVERTGHCSLWLIGRGEQQGAFRRLDRNQQRAAARAMCGSPFLRRGVGSFRPGQSSAFHKKRSPCFIFSVEMFVYRILKSAFFRVKIKISFSRKGGSGLYGMEGFKRHAAHPKTE